MQESAEKVSPFKKITLDLEAGRRPESMDLSPGPSPFEFIFGLGTEGLTPFECELADMGEGESVIIFVKPGEFPEAFQHLQIPPLGITDEVESFYLKVNIQKIVQADQRDVVGALADLANCGDHCCGH